MAISKKEHVRYVKLFPLFIHPSIHLLVNTYDLSTGWSATVSLHLLWCEWHLPAWWTDLIFSPLGTPPHTFSRLYCKGKILGYKRAKCSQQVNTSLLQVDGVKCIAGTGPLNRHLSVDTEFYCGKRVAYVYRATKEINGSKIRAIWGRVIRSHGNSGVLKAKFDRNLPARCMGASVRVVILECCDDSPLDVVSIANLRVALNQ